MMINLEPARNAEVINGMNLRNQKEVMKMETQIEFETLEIGTKESIKLKPARVKIVRTEIEQVGDKKSSKLICFVKHPQAEKEIQISAVKLERNKKLETSGLWVNLDEDKKLRKSSSLVLFLQTCNADNIKSLAGKECDTVEDESGYLVFKAY